MHKIITQLLDSDEHSSYRLAFALVKGILKNGEEFEGRQRTYKYSSLEVGASIPKAILLASSGDKHEFAGWYFVWEEVLYPGRLLIYSQPPRHPHKSTVYD